ncbi:Rpn family recombination-promoting nuclease/putative transposase [Pseudanabaena sp. UWO311]|uniref:Rpn family recombination-promoting nuclease/putative transposase n=1 Tax=Pseudanabaena sp. UWO311 TaxID=2487337 RepID=UPI0011588AE2|nr:Rpn family recombination-promoting nuclease/putative transposase [Pseudanabaena sp. UWO311]TYQ25519.1 Rpn family recombination-promoting nuclease/putative transposase [Pseudanabaena sp. UWO311]
MRTDTLFFQLFQSFHTLLFELIDHPISEAEGYKFSSVEIKEKAFRFDGIFMPETKDKPIFLAEVQFQPKENFYSEFLAEIFLYLNQYRPIQDWQAVAIFARHNCEPAPDKFSQELIALGRIKRVYLEDLRQETDSHGIEIIQLILASEKKAPKLARKLAEKVEQEANTELRDNIVEFIEAVLVYKFPKLSRQEVEAMFTHSDLKKTRVYQDAVLEGKQEGLQIGKQEGLQIGKQEGLQIGEQRGLVKGQSAMLQRQLTRKLGKISPSIKSKISKLSVAQLEDLAEAIFDFQTSADLNAWVKKHLAR